MLKGVFVLLDGLGDLPNKSLNEKTPLEDSQIPNLDFFASRGEMGYMYSVKPGFVPESDEAIISIFGNELISSTRGQLETRGTDIKLVRGDLAMRVNFATIDSRGNILDRRAGRTLTTTESELLGDALNQKINLPIKFVFNPTNQHRAILVFRGGLSDNISGNDTTYIEGKKKPIEKKSFCKSLDTDDENANYTLEIVNSFLKQAEIVLKEHPVNLERMKKGLMPANFLLVRGGGIEPPKLKQYKKWTGFVYMPLEIGFVKSSGMNLCTFEYPELEELDAYKNLYEGLEKACKYAIRCIEKNKKTSDYIYIHIKETDLPGHDNKPFEKKQMIEYIDKTLFNFLRKFAPPNKLKILVTADHSTPCKIKDHTADPVPVLFYDGTRNNIPRKEHFCEKEARKGSLKRILGKDLLKVVGFVK